MTKSKAFAIRMVLSLVLVISLFVGMHALKIIVLPIPLFKLVLILIPFIFLGGGIIVISGLNKAPDVMVNRFMLLTTFQLLAVLSILVAIAFKMHAHLRAFGFQFISIFILLMLMQSYFIVKAANEDKK